MQLAFVALFALVLAPTLCDAQAVRRASPEEPLPAEPSGRGWKNHGVNRPHHAPAQTWNSPPPPAPPKAPKPWKHEHNNEPVGEVCAPETMCYTDDYCDDEFPCVKTECVFDKHRLLGLGYKYEATTTQPMGVCVCFGDKPNGKACFRGNGEATCENAGKCYSGYCRSLDCKDKPK